MQIRVIGSNMDVGEALTSFVNEHLNKEVKKYFADAINAEVHFSKTKHFFKSLILINEGVKSGIIVKSDGEAGDAHAAFLESLEKATKQLRRYKRRIKNYRKEGGGIKNADLNIAEIKATKYVLPPLPYNVYEEMEQNGSDDVEKMTIVSEKATNVESLTVDEAVMKMDLADLPALAFINKDNGRINVVYHRKDGNISWIDTK